MAALHHAAPSAPGGWASRIARMCEDPRLVGVALQPIVDLSLGTVAGYEALARFPGPGGPEPWFAAAAQHGMADEFEAVVLGRTMAARAALPPNTFLTVNVSPLALLGERVQEALDGADGLGGLVLEITEQAAVEDYPALVAAVADVRERGGLVAVDDMGAGHASLSHVLQLRPDFVKLDRDLVAHCDRDEARLAVLEMLGAFADRIDAWVVAEGIERQSELDAVARIGLPLAQGYHLGRPAATPATLQVDLAEEIGRAAAQRGAGVGLAALIEAVPVLDGADLAAIDAAWAVPDPPGVAIVCDEVGRPAGLLLGPGAQRVCATTADVRDEAGDVARRAMSRPAARRFDPVVVCDELGRAVGVLRLERLVDHLAAG